ncbi:PadR family transcriptional regulator [Candidatus Poribacteria bacterium]|nr:PadR family transcriptional regulator [Candidatus Poribacteria bacterium]
MIRRCSDAGLSEPEFADSSGFKTTIWRAKPPEQIKVQPEFLPRDLKSQVLNLLADGPLSRSELSKQLGHKKASGQLYNVVRDLLDDQMIEYTLPDKPRSPRQKYRLTDKGRTEFANLKSEDAV